MDYNATTPLDPAVVQAVSEALGEAWGNPSSTYIAGEHLDTTMNITHSPETNHHI